MLAVGKPLGRRNDPMSTKTKAEPNVKTELSPEHKRVAEALFAQAVVRTKSTTNFPMIAIGAFKAASAFLQTQAAIEAGELDAEPEKPDVPVYIKIPVFNEISEGKFEGIVDPATNKPLFETVAADRDAYAPNLPAEHPINRRFLPRDGVPVEARIEKHKADKLAEKERRKLQDDKVSFVEKFGSALGFSS